MMFCVYDAQIWSPWVFIIRYWHITYNANHLGTIALGLLHLTVWKRAVTAHQLFSFLYTHVRCFCSVEWGILNFQFKISFSPYYQPKISRVTIAKLSPRGKWLECNITLRRQGPHPCTLWSLVGTPSVLWPKLATRWNGAQPTVADILYTGILFLSTKMCVDLLRLGWLFVPDSRIIYKLSCVSFWLYNWCGSGKSWPMNRVTTPTE